MNLVPVHGTPQARPSGKDRDSGSRGCESQVLSRPRRAWRSCRARMRRVFRGSQSPWTCPRWPLLTLGLALLAVLASLPQHVPALETTRAGLAHGEWWRLLSGHFTHWTLPHFAWDWIAFVALGVVLERQGRLRFGALLATSAVAISAAVYAFEPGLTHYRGLSGLDSALFGLAWILAWKRAALAEGLRSARTLALSLLGFGFVAKLAWELCFADAFFMPADSPFVPVPLAHAVGAALGVTFGVRGFWMRQPVAERSSTALFCEAGWSAGRLGCLRLPDEALER